MVDQLMGQRVFAWYSADKLKSLVKMSSSIESEIPIRSVGVSVNQSIHHYLIN